MTIPLRGFLERVRERRKAWVEEHVMSRPLPQRLRRWTYGPIPEDDRGNHLFVVLGKPRVQRLLWAGLIGTCIVWICGLVYRLSQGKVRIGSIVVGAIAVAVIGRSFFILRKALHEPSRAHEYVPTDPDEEPREQGETS